MLRRSAPIRPSCFNHTRRELSCPATRIKTTILRADGVTGPPAAAARARAAAAPRAGLTRHSPSEPPAGHRMANGDPRPAGPQAAGRSANRRANRRVSRPTPASGTRGRPAATPGRIVAATGPIAARGRISGRVTAAVKSDPTHRAREAANALTPPAMAPRAATARPSQSGTTAPPMAIAAAPARRDGSRTANPAMRGSATSAPPSRAAKASGRPARARISATARSAAPTSRGGRAMPVRGRRVHHATVPASSIGRARSAAIVRSSAVRARIATARRADDAARRGRTIRAARSGAIVFRIGQGATTRTTARFSPGVRPSAAAAPIASAGPTTNARRHRRPRRKRAASALRN